MFNNETWWQIGMTIIIGLLSAFKEDPTVNKDKKDKFKRAFLKVYNLIKVVYGDDPDFK